MNTKTRLLKHATLAGLILGLAPFAVAESAAEKRERLNARSQSAEGEYSRDKQSIRQAPDDPRGQAASDLIGTQVHGQGGEALGTLNDFVIDSHSGKIAYAIVSSGGVLGVNSRLRAVPVEALRHSGDRFTIDIDQVRWTEAPVFTKEQIATLSKDRRGAELHDYYGQKPGKNMVADASRFVLVSDIRGKEVHDGQGRLGEIDDVIVRYPSRSTAALLDPTDDFAGTDQKFLVPIKQLKGFERENLRANLSREDFARVAPAERSRDTDEARNTDRGSDRDAAWGSTLAAWGYAAGNRMERGAERVGDATRNVGNRIENATERTGDRMENATERTGDRIGNVADNPAEVTNRRSARDAADNETTRSASVETVRRAVQADARAAGVQGNVQVVAEDDKTLVLRGTVPSEEVKDRLVERAERAAPGWDIESRLRVASNR